MQQAIIKDLKIENFHIYGSFSDMYDPKTPKLGCEPIEFFRDMTQLYLGNTSLASFSVCRVMKRPLIVDVTESHSNCGEGILPLNGDILIHVGIATSAGEAPVEEFEIFRVPEGTFVALRPGVWHHAPFAHGCDSVNVLIVLPERTYANDCSVYNIPEEKHLHIKMES